MQTSSNKRTVSLDRPNILQAKDHRSFLRDFFFYRKSVQKSFSYSYCSRRMQTSNSYLKNVFKGTRNLSMELVSKISRLFELSLHEQSFLTILLVRDLIDDEETRGYFEKHLETFRYTSLAKLDQRSESIYSCAISTNPQGIESLNRLVAALSENNADQMVTVNVCVSSGPRRP